VQFNSNHGTSLRAEKQNPSARVLMQAILQEVTCETIAVQANCTSAVCFSFTKYFKQISPLICVLRWNTKEYIAEKHSQCGVSAFWWANRGGCVSYWCPTHGESHPAVPLPSDVVGTAGQTSLAPAPSGVLGLTEMERLVCHNT